MSIRAMAEEISNQNQDLPEFASHLRERRVPKLNSSTLIFAGSGDSYAAAVFAQELSRGPSVATDPYELTRNIQRTEGKNLIIVSVSGETRANVNLARKAKRLARKCIAITANPDSPLGRECDEVLPLEYRKAGMQTAGTTSFTSSLIACAFLLRQLPKTVNVRGTLREATRWATSQILIGTGASLFIGSGVNYALSIYGAAKIREVLGTKAEADYPEQLGHARLFTIDTKRDTIICISSGQDQACQVRKLLTKSGFRTMLLAIPNDNIVHASLEAAIYLQQLALVLARKRGMKECAFLSDSRTIELSSKLIY
ncbi:SIS domain-containing protein [Candidatus Bathyarchaeota archaeon]|nr:MAG: SIS domain-containing protein [Candidatus Bathyarchaeota archaeon]